VRIVPWLLPAMVMLLIVSVLTAHVAEAQSPTDESYWGEHTLNGIVQTWSVVALVVFGGLLAGGILGLYELDTASLLFLLAGLALLGYHVYWRHVHVGSSLPRLSVHARLALARYTVGWLPGINAPGIVADGRPCPAPPVALVCQPGPVS